MSRLVFVDCEAWGGCPAVGELTEFGAVVYRTGAAFHGVLAETSPSADNPAVPERAPVDPQKRVEVFTAFDVWLTANVKGRPVFVSDNVAYDWQWINDGFWRTLGRNPFGYSGRRISDFYAGLCGDFYRTQDWKALRVTPHDHNPVHDAQGNVEALRRLLQGVQP